MINAEIARAFSNIATLLEIDGANPFRVRAYREAARVVEASAEPMAKLAAEDKRLESLPGIGKDLAAKIRDLVTTGTTPTLEELKTRIPIELVELTTLQGVGPKRVKTLFETLGVRTRDDLARAAKEGKLRDLPGFGEKMAANIVRALGTAEAAAGRMMLAQAWPVAHALADSIRALRGVTAVEIAGSFRRRRETIGDLDLLATGGDPGTVMEAFVGHATVAEVLGRGPTKSSVRLGNGLQVDLRHVPAESYGAALLYFTGSKAHNIELRRIALDQGMSLNEYGLTRDEEVVAARTEEEVYRALGLAYVPPELREALGEIDLARRNALPKLIELEDLRGDLHMHTDRTDGRDSLETMVRAARDRGYEYVAITDHSKVLAMAGGFNEERVRQSVAEIEAVRKQVPGIEVLHGLEVDILVDGALDLADHGLALLDWVVISLHSRLDQPGPVVTERVLAALDHPAVCVMGHPTGRMIGARPGAALDFERIFERAAARGVAMEINAQPHRTDLSDVNARHAHSKGIPLVIDTDAHSVAELDVLRYGVFVARRAGLTRDDVLNTRPWSKFDRARRRPQAALAKAGRDASWPAGPKPVPRATAAKPKTAARKTSRT